MKHYLASVMGLPFVISNSSKSVSRKCDVVLALCTGSVGCNFKEAHSVNLFQLFLTAVL